jgi:hexosaminidase
LDIEPLRTLADVVEPVKEYARAGTGKYRSYTPMNRLVDTARPESDIAREFGKLVSRYLDRKSAEDAAAIRNSLTMWRDNDAKLRPMLSRSHLVAEVAPVSEALTATARIGLEALEVLEKGQPKQKGWAASTLKSAAEPKAEVLLMLVPHVQRLADAASK